MNLYQPTRDDRLNKAVGACVFLACLGCLAALGSYDPGDASANTASAAARTVNWIGPYGAFFADWILQSFGFGGFLLPAVLAALAWHWWQSRKVSSPIARTCGTVLLMLTACAGLGLIPAPNVWDGTIAPGGLIGVVAADALRSRFHLLGSALVVAMALILSLYLSTTFQVEQVLAAVAAPFRALNGRLQAWRAALRERRAAKASVPAAAEPKRRRKVEDKVAEMPPPPSPRQVAEEGYFLDEVPYSAPGSPSAPAPESEIPIRVYEGPLHEPTLAAPTEVLPWEEQPAAELEMREVEEPKVIPMPRRRRREYTLPPSSLLSEPPARAGYDPNELKEKASLIKSKFDEFQVRGHVTQINPGPVVTTYEFKPEAGIKLSKITALDEDLSLGLEAESVRIERLPGKSTVGVEVPNRKSEVISLRQIIESGDFQDSTARLSFALGKDVEGRIKVGTIESMPHLLIAGATGAGKSVMLNSMVCSILYKSTPADVRMIMIDPKRVELSVYEGIPHLLTPVITDPRKATIALKNAVIEMERRLKLMASVRARNIDEYNEKVGSRAQEPSLFDAIDTDAEERLPYVLIIIDELADLMMLERAGVEESVTRLAQMARAVGIHLVLATQRPSVDVITGLIKANFPSRISFRVASRIDSRTILDQQGAEHLLGRGDMLFSPPRATRLMRVHGAYVSEREITRVVEFWRDQAEPDYDDTFLINPEGEDEPAEELDGAEDPMYRDAVSIVCDMGKASTSILQRRLRLGYGRAARILDMMQRDGIIGPPDGPRPRDVLKRPGWIDEVEG
jgi:S-DNA-T family DNA segregation ATPase FtsK/SpoIIIE